MTTSLHSRTDSSDGMMSEQIWSKSKDSGTPVLLAAALFLAELPAKLALPAFHLLYSEEALPKRLLFRV